MNIVRGRERHQSKQETASGKDLKTTGCATVGECHWNVVSLREIRVGSRRGRRRGKRKSEDLSAGFVGNEEV